MHVVGLEGEFLSTFAPPEPSSDTAPTAVITQIAQAPEGSVVVFGDSLGQLRAWCVAGPPGLPFPPHSALTRRTGTGAATS